MVMTYAPGVYPWRYIKYETAFIVAVLKYMRDMPISDENRQWTKDAIDTMRSYNRRSATKTKMRAMVVNLTLNYATYHPRMSPPAEVLQAIELPLRWLDAGGNSIDNDSDLHMAFKALILAEQYEEAYKLAMSK